MWKYGGRPQTGGMKTRQISTRLLAFILVIVVACGRDARADDYELATLVPQRVFLVRGLSLRNGDYLSLEPSFWLTPPDPFVLGAAFAVVARPMLGVGGAGAGIGLATSGFTMCVGQPNCSLEKFFWLPFSLEARIERMYGPTHWRHTTYFGPTLSLSGIILKASVGWMVDASDRNDHHVQVAIGAGF